MNTAVLPLVCTLRISLWTTTTRKPSFFRNNFIEFCPRLVSTSCLYIASKVEECSTQAPAFRFEREMKKHGKWAVYYCPIHACGGWALLLFRSHLAVHHKQHFGVRIFYSRHSQFLFDCISPVPHLSRVSIHRAYYSGGCISWNVCDHICTY
jgi:hypothetical protein